MKTKFFQGLRRAFRCWPRGRRLRAALPGVALLLAATFVQAAAVVDTVTGGPSQFYPSPASGYVDGNTTVDAKFFTPSGLAFDPSGNLLFVADRDNNVVRKLNLPGNNTSTFAAGATNRINQPVGVVVDGATNVYILSRGNGNNGTVLKFTPAGSFVSTNAAALTNATALALDGVTNLFVTLGSNTVMRITPTGVKSTVAVITNAGTSLQGIAIMDNGNIAVSDAGNHGIWLVNPFTGTWSELTGFNGAGDTFDTKEYAQFRSPWNLAKAGNGTLVVADRGNHRVKIVDAAGTVANLYGVKSNFWVQGSPAQGIYPGWWDQTVCESDTFGCDEARSPWGVVVAPSGDVFTTETHYHLLRTVTATGLLPPGTTGVAPQFNQPVGVALDSTGDFLFIADQMNNAVYKLNFANNVTQPFAATNLSNPVAVALDPADNLYVLNQGSGPDGYILKFNKFGNFLGTNAAGLTNATALALDGSTNMVVAELGGTIKRIPPGGPATVIATVTNAGVQLRGLVVQDDGTIAVSDAGNHAIFLINPISYAVTLLSGNNGPGNTIGTAPFAQFNQPHQIAKAGGGLLIVADYANDRVAVVDPAGTSTDLGATNSQVWFGRTGDPVSPADSRFVPMQLPAGIVVAPNGDVITGEVLNHNIRRLLDTGLTGPGGGSGGTNGVVVTAPTISPNTGYFPMGQIITVGSPNPNVFYTMDGSEPTTNSARVTMFGNTGFISWVSTTNDLTALRVKAFVNTNSSATIGGVAASANNVGVPPAPTVNLLAGIGSKIMVPVVSNLRTNDQVRSFQFRVEVTPNGGAPMIPDLLDAVSIDPTNDFIPVVTAVQSASVGTFSVQPYTIGSTRGLVITAIGTNANMFFQRFAVVALLTVPIPGNATEGQTYSISVNNSSATSDGAQTYVPFPPMAAATILVTNVLYTVGDSAFGGWYNAGGFGNGNLDNADVNNCFYAASGLRLPFPSTDVYDAMDAYPEDETGFVGGDAEIRFLDWQVILNRSLRLPPYNDGTNNWNRAWASGGDRTNVITVLPPNLLNLGGVTLAGKTLVYAPWNRQAKVVALPVGYASAGGVVNVPVYVRTANDATLTGLQFRCLVTPDNGGPALGAAPTFIPAAGIPGAIQQSFKPSEFACGWPLGSFNFAARTSNYLGTIRFTMPPGAALGHTYTVAFANADGAPNLQTQYTFESKRATVSVGIPALAPDITSDDWKVHFFGSLADPNADPNGDPDHDHVLNWAEYLAGTDPTDAASRLLCESTTQTVKGQRQLVLSWLSAPGKAYEVLGSASASGGTWTVLDTVSGDGTVAEYVESNPNGARFYRLRVLP